MDGPTAPAPPDTEAHAGAVARTPRRSSHWVSGLFTLVALYAFICSINLISHGLKMVASEPASKALMMDMFALASHPLAGLSIGILITSVVQSSSFTTSLAVTLVAAGQLPLDAAVFIIMGANIGTSITNLMVSLANLRRRRHFQRALAGAVVHDLVNVLTVAIVLPGELLFGMLSRPAHWFAEWLKPLAATWADPHRYALVKGAIKPVLHAFDTVLVGWVGLREGLAGMVTAVLAVLLLFAALYVLVRTLQGLMRSRLSAFFNQYFFRNQGIAFVVGLLLTVCVQSSSVTTSLVVPLVAARILTIHQIFPYTLGANIGTTVTALLAGLALLAGVDGKSALAASGLALALTHLLFNTYETCVFWPLQWIPIRLARGFARLAARRRVLAAVYLLAAFFLVPILVIVLVNLL